MEKDRRPAVGAEALEKMSFYVLGGTLQADASCYVRRRCDETLFQSLQEGAFCYVLTSRQMGKSSLMVRPAVRLRADGDSEDSFTGSASLRSTGETGCSRGPCAKE